MKQGEFPVLRKRGESSSIWSQLTKKLLFWLFEKAELHFMKQKVLKISLKRAVKVKPEK